MFNYSEGAYIRYGGNYQNLSAAWQCWVARSAGLGRWYGPNSSTAQRNLDLTVARRRLPRPATCPSLPCLW